MKKPRCRAVMKSVPEDIAMDIRLRLPVKSLLRFKCVSKSWYSLISDPSFIKLHLQYSNNHQKFLVPNSYIGKPYLYDLFSRESTQISLPYKNIKQHQQIVCSCNGLLLLECSYGETEHIFVWNPLTRESRELPKVDTSHCNPLTTGYNIGYDSSTDDYNVIRYERSLPNGGFDYSLLQRDLMVFSLKKSSSWRRIKDFKHDIILFENCMNFNGALHWLRCFTQDKIICFSLAKETIIEMELPNIDDCCVKLKLSILQGCLCLTTLHLHHPSVFFNVWLMKEYGPWTKFVTIPHLTLIGPLRTTPVTYHSMKKAIFIMKQQEDSLLVVYDVEKKEVEIKDWFNKYPHLKIKFAFVESLVSPNCRIK